MATRKSLTSRGYTSVQAGPSSTNKFLNPPRTVSEYKTVAEEVADLRTAKNAVGPAAQPLRPRARVEPQQVSEGQTPSRAEMPQMDLSLVSDEILSERAASQRAKLDGAPLSFGLMTLFTPPMISMATGAATSSMSGSVEALEKEQKTREVETIINKKTARETFSSKISKALTPNFDFDFDFDIVEGVKEGVDTLDKAYQELINPSRTTKQERELRNRQNFEGNPNPTNYERFGPFSENMARTTTTPDEVYDTLRNAGIAAPNLGLLAPNINLSQKAKTNAKAKALDKVSKVSRNPFNINRVRVSYEPPAFEPTAFEPTALQKAKQNAQAVTLAQKQQANDAITAGNYGSSGSDESGGFDSGVDDSGQATGQDQYD
jgi:hypothetical protein